MSVLITGGAGFIGSTIASALMDQGEDVVIIDDLSKGLQQYVNGRTHYIGNVGDRELLDKIFTSHNIEAVIHCAAKIVVPESVSNPMGYYRNNIAYGQTLIEACVAHGCRSFIFSSSGSIYSPRDGFCFTEASPVDPHSPYSQTKADFETYLKYVAAASGLDVVCLRYFNPIGCDPSYRTGLQDPHPSHVLGKIMEAARDGVPFTVTGVDWETRDGSGLRDYIHVWDLARAHYSALEYLRGQRGEDSGAGESTGDGLYEVVNVGTGTGYTVIELFEAARKVLDKPIVKLEGPRRPGDVIGGYAETSKASELLGWKAELSIEQGIADSVKWSGLLPQILQDADYRPDAK